MKKAPTPAAAKKRSAQKRAEKKQLDLFESPDKPDQQVIYASAKETKTKRVKKLTEQKQGKKLEEYKRTRPPELKAFEFLAAEDKQYSNTIELYDFIPKHYWGKEERENGKYLPTLKREFECRGVRYKAIIGPARIDDKDHYAGRREELVEVALRKLACYGHGAFLDDSASVIFSLNELQDELKSMGHTFSVAEIKEALLICVKTSIEVRTDDGTAVFVSSIFETLGLRTWEDWQTKGQQTRCFVRFNSLITGSLKSGAFRRFNYEKYMSCKHVTARQLYKRMSHHYIQASMANTYEVMLSTIIRDFGLKVYDRLKDNLREVELALKEMIKEDIILEYKIEKTLDSSRQNKVVDAKIAIRPHPRFSSEMIKANERQRQVRTLLSPPPNLHA